MQNKDNKVFVGIDVHNRSWSVSIYTTHAHYKTYSQEPDISQLVNLLRKDFPSYSYYSVYEAGFSGYWLHNELEQLGVNNIVIHPGDVPTTQRDKHHKSDVVDSKKLGLALRADQLRGIYIPGIEQQHSRSLVRYRKKVLGVLNQTKNRLKSQLKYYGIVVPEEHDNSNWSNRFITWIEELEMSSDWLRCTFGHLLDQLYFQKAQLLKVEQDIRNLLKSPEHREKVKLLRSVPGVGPLTSAILLTELWDMARFSNRDQLNSYVKLTPRMCSSGETERVGSITPRRNTQLRTAIIEASWVAIKQDSSLMRCYEEYCKRMKGSKAIVKVARKLLSRIRYVMLNEEPYEMNI